MMAYLKQYCRLPLASLALVLLFAACAGSNSEKKHVPREMPVSVYVDNQRTTSMTIFVVDGAIRSRLGEVGGLSQKLFPIPADLVSGRGTVQFIADPIGGVERSYTNEISVRPGEEVRLTITPF